MQRQAVKISIGKLSLAFGEESYPLPRAGRSKVAVLAGQMALVLGLLARRHSHDLNREDSVSVVVG